VCERKLRVRLPAWGLMGFQLPTTIADAVKEIQSGDLVLPAIQREFVWEESR
jgi:uncharacterized protein with ParB-like and HNH nuclease domain